MSRNLFIKNSDELFILYCNGDWEPVKNIPKYNDIYEKIKELLKSNKKNHKRFEPCEFDVNGIIVYVYNLQKHRGATVCFCKQFDPVTQSNRILAYGLSHPEDAVNYGIGTILSDITPAHVNNPYGNYVSFLLEKN